MTIIWAVLTGPTDWVCHIGILTLCVEAVAQSCIIVTWWSGSDGIQAWSRQPTGFLQCFDTVGLVIWPVKIIPEMTYNVSCTELLMTSDCTPETRSPWPSLRIKVAEKVGVNRHFTWDACVASTTVRNNYVFKLSLCAGDASVCLSVMMFCEVLV